jgi:Ca2+/H+ antiporter
MAPLLFLIAPWYQCPPVSMELAFADLVCVCVSMAPLLFLIAPWYQRPPVSMELAFADLVCVCSFLCCPWHEYDKLRAES